MRNRIILIFYLFASCGNRTSISGDSVFSNNSRNCMKLYYVDQEGYGGLVGYSHYIFICDSLMDDSSLLKLSIIYKDSCTRQIPITSIYFLKDTTDFGKYPDGHNWDLIRKQLIYEVAFGFGKQRLESHRWSNGAKK